MFHFARNTLRFRLVLILSLLTLIIIGTLSSLHAWHEIRSYRQRSLEKARILAEALAASARLPLFSDDRESLNRLARETASFTGVEEVVIATHKGEVAASAGNLADRKVGDRIRWEALVLPTPTGEPPEVSLGLVPENAGELGRVRVTMGIGELQTFIQSLLATTSVMAILCWLVVNFISYQIIQRGTRSLALLVDGLKTMQDGDYLTRINPVGNDELSGAVAAVNNLAENLQKREAENERLRRDLELSRRHLQTILDNLPMHAWLKDAEGRYLMVNQRQVEIIGRPREAIIEATDLDIWPRERAERYRAEDQRVMASRIRFEEEQAAEVEGKKIWFEVYKAPVTNDQDEVVGTVGVARDITERKMAEQTLAEYTMMLKSVQEQADAANRAKSEFLANMSHEIRTPMNGIIGMAQLLEFTALTDQQKQFLDAIRTSSQNLLSLINDVLDLSKIESGKIELERRDFSLRQSISDVIKTQISLVYKKELDLNVDIPADVPDNLSGDQLRLKQILLNLLGNAIKFTKQGGIRIAVEVVERQGTIAILRIRVTDTGIGISPEALEKIFDPFVQADASTTRQYGGTGLGLTICTQLAELMGGSLRAESREGGGSTFFLHLPLFVNDVAVEHRNRQTGDHTFPIWTGPPLRILLVDDQETNLLVATNLLQNAGHAVVEARDGREALERWGEGGIDVILMDIQMPVMSGIEAVKAIRERERSGDHHIPIIAVTARALHEERNRIMSQGFDGYLTKPYEFGELLSELKRCLESE